MNLPPALLLDLIDTLLECAPLQSEGEWRSLFIDRRLHPWRADLPPQGSPRETATTLITLLSDRQGESGRSGLLLFLDVLQARLHPEDTCHARIGELGRRLETVAEASRPAPIPLDRFELALLIGDRLTDAELKSLCLYLDVDYERLPAGEKMGRARELVLYLERLGRLPELPAAGRRVRPDLPWPVEPTVE